MEIILNIFDGKESSRSNTSENLYVLFQIQVRYYYICGR